jgi:hypothetical protein
VIAELGLVQYSESLVRFTLYIFCDASLKEMPTAGNWGDP